MAYTPQCPSVGFSTLLPALECAHTSPPGAYYIAYLFYHNKKASTNSLYKHRCKPVSFNILRSAF
nr:MAG TPA_asm: hypothetical protein [Bacteriophage sp.]